MLIGIDASRAFIKNRTGIEEYSYQVIKNLRDKLTGHQVIIYIRKNQEIDLVLPENWKIKKLWLPYFTAQVRFSLEFLFNPVDMLFVPAHVVPPIHSKKTIVVIHGLEYEFCPEAYSWRGKFYMRRVIKNSCRWASKIICVSQNTKKDLMKLYKTPEEKIEVIYEGCNFSTKYEFYETTKKITNYKLQITNLPYLLFIGRLEKRKNIAGIIKAFEILKEKYNVPHKLVLAGGKGYGYKNVKCQMSNVKCQNDIILTGFVSEKEKWKFLKNADVFLFPSFYEGFGLPILEAQSVGTPVVAGDNSSIPEVTGSLPLEKGELERDLKSVRIKESVQNNDNFQIPREYCARSYSPSFPKGEVKNSALLVNPHNPEEIAEAAYKLISDKDLRNDIIEKGYKNVKRFSWEKCADSIAKMLMVANGNE